jgi:hypothetical protein
MLLEVADLPCGWDVCDGPLVVRYWIWEWLVKWKWRLKVRRTHRIDILAGYVYFLDAAWTAPSSSSVQLAAKLCGYHLPEASLTMS